MNVDPLSPVFTRIREGASPRGLAETIDAIVGLTENILVKKGGR